MPDSIGELARKLLNANIEELTEREREVLRRISQRKRISRNVNRVIDESSRLGDRIADRVAAFGGSWGFIGLFGLILLAWIGVNTALVNSAGEAFDPYPFIFLNLILSMLAAIQAPVIMMSQNRQSAKDRTAAANDYEVNLKAELEIMRLHEKLDELRQNQLAALIEQQQKQIEQVERLLNARPQGPEGS